MVKKRSAVKKSRKRTTTKKVTPKQVAPWDIVKKLSGDPVAMRVPWGMSAPFVSAGATYVKGFGYVLDRKSVEDDSFMSAYAEKRYSWKDFVLRKASGITGRSRPTTSTGLITLRPDQVEDRDKVLAARDSGAPEFLIASGTGVGKTVTTVAAVNAMKGRTVLVVCPKSVIPGWRSTLNAMGDSGKEWVVVNYESLMPMMKQPTSALNASKKATKNKNTALHGSPWFQADIVVTDEAHKLRNPTSQQTRFVDKFVDNADFTIRLTATPGEDPSQLHWLRRGLSWATGDEFIMDDDYKGFMSWCKRHKVNGIHPAKFGNGVSFDGSRDDIERMNSIIFDHNPPWAIVRKPEGWPEQKQSGLPVDLEPEDMVLYEKEWDQFCRIMNGLKAKGATKAARAKGLAALTRYRQKVGVLKAPLAVEQTLRVLEGGEHVVIACVYRDTVEKISEGLEKAGVDFAVMTGEVTGDDREAERLRFQKGDVPVIITSVTTGVSLHAGEKILGNDADMSPRRMIIAEPQWSAVETKQMFGRVHRDGEDAPVSILMATGTIDEKVTGVLLHKISNMATVTGDDGSGVADILDELGLPGSIVS